MVEFCNQCRTSLPKGDLTIKNGTAFTSPDYVCPDCHQVANPSSTGKAAGAFELREGTDVLISDGELKES